MSGAEAFVEMLVSNGVDYIFINSGLDVFLIQEAVSKFSANRKPVSRLILCPDEATAISAAHGYFMVSKNHK